MSGRILLLVAALFLTPQAWGQKAQVYADRSGAIRGLDPVTRVFQIADGLLRRGFSAADVELVLGGNFLRVLAAIWPASSWSIASERELRRDPFCPAPAS